MNITDFINGFRNHPVLFVGTGFSLRYLEKSYTWDALLARASYEIFKNEETYLDIKDKCYINGRFDFAKIASEIENSFNDYAKSDRDGDLKAINDIFYENIKNGKRLSRFKIFICELLKDLTKNEKYLHEIPQLNKAIKNIGSVITTNYDTLLEEMFEFLPLIGNDILMSEPYGSIYKIHGSITDAESIILTEDDYSRFEQKYELIRAQLLSIFIHNPIVFIGYSITDENIKAILKTIFRYVQPNTKLADDIRGNFLLIEYEKDSSSIEVVSHDIDIEGYSTIRINRISTDDYSSIYNAISNLQLPVSVMDVRKVQNIFKEIKSGGDIQVRVTEDISSLKNSDKMLVIGSEKSIKYEYRNKNDLIKSYFEIIEKENRDVIKAIDKLQIRIDEWFPCYMFSKIYPSLNNASRMRENQKNKLTNFFSSDIPQQCKTQHSNIASVLSDDTIAVSYKNMAIAWSSWNDGIELGDLKDYIESFETINSDSRRLLCIYDYKLAIGPETKIEQENP